MFSRLLPRIAGLLQIDFFPQVNPYLYWLKQPIGWFVVAMFASVLVGAFASPIGWTIAIGLFSLICLGLVFPWIAVRSTRMELHPVISEIHEGEEVDLLLKVQNRLPIPLVGLTVSGFLAASSDEEDCPPDLGLSQIPALAKASYRLPVCPKYRGRYPAQTPKFACGFPFGIWNAQKELNHVSPMLVRPLLIPLKGQLDLPGDRIADVGQGNRASTVGEFMGVRGFRAGDSLKSIHWTQTAKLDEFVVCERGGPQHQQVLLVLDATDCDGGKLERRENLAWRVRIAASFIDLLGGQQIPFRLMIDGTEFRVPEGIEGIKRAWEHLANIPLDGGNDVSPKLPTNERYVHVAPAKLEGSRQSELVSVAIHNPGNGLRVEESSLTTQLNLDEDIEYQLNQFVSAMGNVSYVT